MNARGAEGAPAAQSARRLELSASVRCAVRGINSLRAVLLDSDSLLLFIDILTKIDLTMKKAG